jgi:NIPSNAP
MNHECPVVELRQYTLHPGTREALVSVFEVHFIEGQEAYGMYILGQFRDLSDPDRFVWLRGFADMEACARAIEGFYSGPVWKEHGSAANATMIDHTNVLLLKPARPGSGLRFDPRRRPPPQARETAGGIVVATILHLAVPVSAAVIVSLGDQREPAARLAELVTEPARTPATRLPVREDANVLVRLTCHPSAGVLPPAPSSPSSLVSRVERLILEPTRRSFIRHDLLLQSDPQMRRTP